MSVFGIKPYIFLLFFFAPWIPARLSALCAKTLPSVFMEAPAVCLCCANHFHFAGTVEALHVCPVNPDMPGVCCPPTQKTSVINCRLGEMEMPVLAVRRRLHAHKNKDRLVIFTTDLKTAAVNLN